MRLSAARRHEGFQPMALLAPQLAIRGTGLCTKRGEPGVLHVTSSGSKGFLQSSLQEVFSDKGCRYRVQGMCSHAVWASTTEIPKSNVQERKARCRPSSFHVFLRPAKSTECEAKSTMKSKCPVDTQEHRSPVTELNSAEGC